MRDEGGVLVDWRLDPAALLTLHASRAGQVHTAWREWRDVFAVDVPIGDVAELAGCVVFAEHVGIRLPFVARLLSAERTRLDPASAAGLAAALDRIGAAARACDTPGVGLYSPDRVGLLRGLWPGSGTMVAGGPAGQVTVTEEAQLILSTAPVGPRALQLPVVDCALAGWSVAADGWQLDPVGALGHRDRQLLADAAALLGVLTGPAATVRVRAVPASSVFAVHTVVLREAALRAARAAVPLTITRGGS